MCSAHFVPIGVLNEAAHNKDERIFCAKKLGEKSPFMHG